MKVTKFDNCKLQNGREVIKMFKNFAWYLLRDVGTNAIKASLSGAFLVVAIWMVAFIMYAAVVK